MINIIIDSEHGHSYVNPPLCSCHTIVSTRSTVYRDPKAAQGTSKTDYWRGRWVAAQKSPISIWQGENQPAGGNPESNLSCPGPRDIKRDAYNQLSSWAKVQFNQGSTGGDGRSRAQRFGPLRGNGQNRAQWEKNFACLASSHTPGQVLGRHSRRQKQRTSKPWPTVTPSTSPVVHTKRSCRSQSL